MARKRSSRRRKTAPWYKLTRTWLAVLCLAGGILYGLVWMAGQSVPPPAPPIAPQAPPDLTAAIKSETEAFLTAADFHSVLAPRDPAHRPLRYTVEGDPPPAELLNDLRLRLQQHSPRLSAEMTSEDILVIAEAGRERALVFFVPPLVGEPAGPRVAIIMDDLGRGVHAAEVLLGIEQAVTFSILPGESHARRVAQMAHAAQREVLLHVPMEPQGYPAVNPGGDALLVRYDEQEIARRLDELFDRVPHAVGTNNHMGSRFTEDRRGMAAVMAVLRQRELFFIDSLTTGKSVGAAAALESGVPMLKRDVFLDNVADVELIAVEIQRLAATAVRHGQAIGICHPYPATLQALQRELPRLVEQGIQIVPASKLFQPRPSG